MKIVAIYGQSHKGITYQVTRNLIQKIGGETKEYFLPRDFGEFCVGCNLCFLESEEKCPHFSSLKDITTSIDEADVLILASPVYVFHASGPMKAFLDHYGYRWMVHRPEESMFLKQAVCISTAMGAGMKSANKDMMDSLLFWGVGKIYRLGVAVLSMHWDEVDEKKKRAIDRATSKIEKKILSAHGRVKPSIKTRVMFSLIRLFQKRRLNETDAQYWEDKGWLGDKRPWNMKKKF